MRSSPEHPLGDGVETFLRREDAERFVEWFAEMTSNSRVTWLRGSTRDR